MKFAFDLDGTLITARERQMTLLATVMKRYHIQIDEDDVWRQKRMGASTDAVLAGMAIDERVRHQICDAWLRDVESAYWLSVDTLFADTLTSLWAFAEKFDGLVLLTARRNEFLMRQQLCRLGLEGYFGDICCVSPFSAVVDKAERLGAMAIAGFVGDSETDLKAAKLAKVPFYALSTGQRSSDFLKANGADVVYDSLRALTQSFSDIRRDN